MFYLWYSFLWTCLFIIKSVTAQCCLNHVLFGGKNEFIDLTFPLDNRTVYFKSETLGGNFTLIEHNDSKKWPKFDEIRTPNFGGTHIVTPYFVKEDGFSVGDIPAEKLIVQLIVIDVSSRVNDDSKYVLYMKDVESALDKDSLEHMSKYNSLVVFKFGWSKHYYHSKYLGYDEKTDSYDFPSVSTEVAQWLISDKSFKVVGIGIDLLSPDTEVSFQVHKILAKAGIYIVNGLNLDLLNVTGHNCTVGVLPMKIAGTAAAPVSVVAACPTVASCDDGDHESGEESEDHEKKDQGHLSGCHGHGCHHGHSCHHGHGSHHHSSHGEHESSNHESHESNELHTQKPEQSGQGTTTKPNNQGNKQQVTSTGSPNIMGTISKIKDKLPFPGKF